jgi:undecaprenyl-diphosphatase
MSQEPVPLREAVMLGAIQGPAELLPVSSSGHVALIPRLLDWRYAKLDAELRKSFEVAVHAGTAAALLIGLRDEVAEYVRNFRVHNAASLTLSFTPAAVVALRLERPIEQHLGEPLPVAFSLIAGSLAMLLADGRPQRRRRNDANLRDALALGIAQAVALAPGVSRNGATLTAARLRGFRRVDANDISRQIALPVIVGACALKGVRLLRRGVPAGFGARLASGAGSAFASTLISMRLIAMFERSRSLRPYALYRIGLAGVVLWRLWADRQRTEQATASARCQPVAEPVGAVE